MKLGSIRGEKSLRGTGGRSREKNCPLFRKKGKEKTGWRKKERKTRHLIQHRVKRAIVKVEVRRNRGKYQQLRTGAWGRDPKSEQVIGPV